MQSPTLGILCKKEIDLFVPEEFWDLIIELSDDNGNIIQCDLVRDGEKKFGKQTVKTESEANLLKEKILNFLSLLMRSLKKKKIETLTLLFQLSVVTGCFVQIRI